MKLGFRRRIFLLSLSVMLLAGLASGSFLEYHIRKQTEAHLQTSLLLASRMAQQALELASQQTNPTLAWNAIAHRLGHASNARITIIDDEGHVLGDSQLPSESVKRLENHKKRPEVQQALQSGSGDSKRYSTTLQTTMVYHSRRFRHGQRFGIVRAAMPLHTVHEALSRLHNFFLLAGGFGMLIAILLGALTSNLASRTLKQLVDKAKQIALDHNPSPRTQQPTDEFEGLAGSLNRIAAEWERSAKELANERNQLETVLQSMNSAVLTVDPDMRIVLDNPSALSRLGLKSSPVGQFLFEAVPSPELRKLANNALTNQPCTEEFNLPGPPTRRVLVRATPLSRMAGAVLVIHDMTELRKLENIRRDFVANISHELRTPLSIIRANLETLLDGAADSPDLAKHFLDVSLRHAQRLANLISDLLDLSKIEAGQYNLAVQPLAIANVIQSTVEAVQSAQQEKRMHVHNKVDASLRVFADLQALEQILINLLDNAVKYTPAEGTITIRAHAQGEQLCIEIQDNGPGLEPQHHARIFERFYRVDSGRSRKVGGTGLGLAIVKHLTQTMNGQVGVRSATPSGSLFWFKLPLAPSAHHKLSAPQPHQLHNAANHPQEPHAETIPPSTSN